MQAEEQIPRKEGDMWDLRHVEFNCQRGFQVSVFRRPLEKRIWARSLNLGIIDMQVAAH